MLQVIKGLTRRAVVQRDLKRLLKSELNSVGIRTIGFPGGNQRLQAFAFGENRLLAAFGRPPTDEHARHWNAFGLFDPKAHSHDIEVEINVAVGDSGSVAGTIATDDVSGRTYLLHTGRVGGGRPGVSKAAFRAWSDWSRSRLVEVHDGERLDHDAVLIGAIEPGISAKIERYVREVAAFKDWIRSPDSDVTALQAKIKELQGYDKEAAGRRRRKALPEIDVIAEHGEVVDALYLARKSRLKRGEDVFNTPLIDLYAFRKGKTFEVYEVKTTTDRQALYTAIGQLMTHGPAGGDASLYLVVPTGDLPQDIETGLTALNVEVIRWKTKGDGYVFAPEPGA